MIRAKDLASCGVHENPHVRSDELLGAAVDSLARMSLSDAPAALIEGLFASTGRHRDGSRFRTHVWAQLSNYNTVLQYTISRDDVLYF